MDVDEFRSQGRDMIDYIADYMKTIHQRQPLPSVVPGYMRQLIPDRAPDTAESWDDVKRDIDRVIMPGVTHWHSPHFHAYYPTANSFPAILGDMLSDAIGCVGFSWASSPACTELEVYVMNWLAKMLLLPNEFLYSDDGKGGGVIQGTASEATLVALLSARAKVFSELKRKNADWSHGQMLDKLVAYTSEEGHCSVERAALIGLVRIRKLQTDDKGSLRGGTLMAAVEEDLQNGLVPFFLCATVGTTSSCAFDNLKELGPVCTQHNVWMHVDAAYAGSACICPEFRYLLDGVEHCMTFNFNPHKWLRVNFDCSALWVRDRDLIIGAFDVDPLYLKHDNQGQIMPDYRHWQIPLGRRFRSLKLWFVLRMFGIKGLQQQIRKDVGLAKEFEALVKEDKRFELAGPVTLGLVCFRLKGPNTLSQTLHKQINEDRRIHLVPTTVKGVYYLRFVICASGTQSCDVAYAWSVVQEMTDAIHLASNAE